MKDLIAVEDNKQEAARQSEAYDARKISERQKRLQKLAEIFDLKG